MNLSDDRAQTATQLLAGSLGPSKLRRQMQLDLLRLQRSSPEVAFEGLVEWARLGLALKKMDGRPALDGHVVLDVLRESRLAQRIAARHRKVQRERGLALQRFEHRKDVPLSAAVQRVESASKVRTAPGVTTTQLFDRFSTDRRRLGFR